MAKYKCINCGRWYDEEIGCKYCRNKKLVTNNDEKDVSKDNYQNMTSKDYEVDFVAENPNQIIYYQVAKTIVEEKVLKREIRSLESISDNYEKVILTMDRTLNNDYNGIKVVNLIDWLLK